MLDSSVIGIMFMCLVLVFHDKYGLLFMSNEVVLNVVDRLSVLLAFTLLLNSIQPVLSGKKLNLSIYHVIVESIVVHDSSYKCRASICRVCCWFRMASDSCVCKHPRVITRLVSLMGYCLDG